MVNLQRNEEEVLPTFSADEFELKTMAEQLRKERELKKQAVARLLKEEINENENNGVVGEELDGEQLEELAAMIPEDDCEDDLGVAHSAPSFKDLIDFAEQRQDDEGHHDVSSIHHHHLKLDDDDDQWIPYVASDLTCDSYELAMEQAYQIQLQHQQDATDQATARERVTVYTNHPRQEVPPEASEEQSVGSLAMLVNHLTCNAQDTITWGDWKAWVY